jgi:hypothetical protein
MGPATHADPTATAGVKRPPAITVSAASNAPTRFEDLYNRQTHKWNPLYVQPTEYRLSLHRAEAVPTLADPVRWHLESEDHRFGPIDITDNGINVTVFGAPSKGTVVARVPMAGSVKVTSTWRGNLLNARVDLRDFLVVSIGDSFSSGQGNPDHTGTESLGGQVLCETPTLIKLGQAIADGVRDGLDWVEDIPGLGDIVNFGEDILGGAVDLVGEAADLIGLGGGPEEFVHMTSPPVWLEPKAWRSLKSSMAQAAIAAEIRGWSRLTTFVSVATSGAEIEKGLLEPQHADWQKAGQVEEVRRMLLNPHDLTNLVRPVDVLIMSIGGNDCGFSGTLTDLTNERFIVGMGGKRTQPEAREKITRAIKGLKPKYAKLNDVIRRSLAPKSVLIPEYPAPIFDGADRKPREGCGIFDLAENLDLIHPMGISKSDAAFIEEMGNLLNETIAGAAQANDWIVVGGVAKAFKGHGYCAAHTFWRSASESCHQQDDMEGTAHPNADGTKVVAGLLATKLHEVLNDYVKNDPTAGVRPKPAARGPARKATAK